MIDNDTISYDSEIKLYKLTEGATGKSCWITFADLFRAAYSIADYKVEFFNEETLDNEP